MKHLGAILVLSIAGSILALVNIENAPKAPKLEQNVVVSTTLLEQRVDKLADLLKEKKPKYVATMASLDKKDIVRENIAKDYKGPIKIKKPIKNKMFFNLYIYRVLGFEECSKCKNVCHNPSKSQDKGLLTCKGFSYRHFPKIVNTIQNTVWKTRLQRERYIKEQYWHHYGRWFHKCSVPVFHLLVDSAVNEGKRTAIRRHQRVSKITVDGQWGPQSLAKCQVENYPIEAFTANRIARYKRIAYGNNLKGWIKRANRKQKEFYQLKTTSWKKLLKGLPQ